MGVTAVLAAGIGATLILPLLRYWQTESPDGSFIAAARTRPVDQFLSMMPGQGGDKPGHITVYRKDGRSRGSKTVPMVNFIYGMHWDFEKKPRLARIGWSFVWDLDAC
jgi:hypothetical protein